MVWESFHLYEALARGIRVEVTEEHITEGRQGYASQNPVSLALEEARFSGAYVYPEDLYPIDSGNLQPMISLYTHENIANPLCVYEDTIDEEIRDAIRKHYDTGEMEPFTFLLINAEESDELQLIWEG